MLFTIAFILLVEYELIRFIFHHKDYGKINVC